VSFKKPEGSWVALVTPFDDKGRVNYDCFFQLVDFHQKNGTSLLLVLGSTGEATMLSMEEKKSIIKEVSTFAKGKMETYFGTTCSTTTDTIALSRYAESVGADGALFLVPPYLRLPQSAIYEYLREVMDSVRIPVAIYNNPARVAVNIDPETVERLTNEFDHFVADKEAMPSCAQLVEVARRCGDRLHILCCDYPAYSIVLPTLALGGHGTANIGGNIIPQEMAEISRPWKNMDDIERARSVYFKVYDLLKMLYSITNPVSVKAAVKMLGFPVGEPRKPLQPMRSPHLEQLRKIMEELGIFDKYKA
jgi:4-hydroxy-tetrahydrodipicolinate synthase